MDILEAFLRERKNTPSLARYTGLQPLRAVVITPRFRASSHVVFLLYPAGKTAPTLVAKVPRLPGPQPSLIREAANLRALQALWPEGDDSVPRLLLFEEFAGHAILLETALVGPLLSPERMRREGPRYRQLVADWLTELHRRPVPEEEQGGQDDWFARLVERPLDFLEAVFAQASQERALLDRTRELLAPLARLSLPLVFQHGDLSHPNLVLQAGGRLGVLDWELAEPRGLPACDLYFFLAYAAFAQARANRRGGHVRAFQQAFFGPDAWTLPYLGRYAEAIRLSPQALTPLFVATWMGVVANQLMRLAPAQPGAPFTGESFTGETVAWLRRNRYFRLWEHAVQNVDRLGWRASLPISERVH